MAEDDIAPIGLYNLAHSFWGAANALQNTDWRERVTHPNAPGEFLYWHAMELFLKAYLLADGIDLEKLRKDYGHDINKLSQKAKSSGLQLSETDWEHFTFMPSASDMINLRYPKTGFRRRLVDEELSNTCRSLFSAVGIELQRRDISIGPHAVAIKRQ